MADIAPREDKRRVHFDGTTAGNLLTPAAMVVALLAWGFGLEGRMEAVIAGLAFGTYQRAARALA